MPEAMLARMRYLEAEDARCRREGRPVQESLCAVPPETGRFLALMAALAPPGAIVEIGTSGGYSTLWLTRAGRIKGETVKTFELREAKAAIARETFRLAGIERAVELAVGDARARLPELRDVGFAFVDHDKSQYRECYDALVPNLVSGAVLIADNILSHREVLAGFTESVMADERMDAVLLPVGKGLLVCRRR
jgi:predicted O-methyltransferase YrrM